MKIVYKIYEITIINVEPTIIREQYGTRNIFPTILKEFYIENDYDEAGVFDTLEAAEEYMKTEVVKDYGDEYTILKEYRYE